RIVHPYPFTFATFAKARWVGRTVVDVYNEEFGSYPKSYYEAAIDAGRILVSGRPVDREYKIQGGDELNHLVHRHEPAVGLSDIIYDNGTITADYTEHPPVQIVYEDNSLLIVDKPSTIAIHTSGAYNYNSLFEILSYWNPQAYGLGRLFTVHRLDRLTSGLVLIAKTPELARSMGKCIMERDGCEKLYLTRVKGKFPLNVMEKVASDGGIDAQNDNEHPHLTEEADRKGIKPAQTSFTLLTYDAVSDTSVVLAKPVTGRTHQIRLHLQQLGHPIANDHCY
ncbi:predicted protein, partial [Thalassiosira pseudonana CCMP1335]